MNKRCIKRLASKFGVAFDLRETPSNPELEDIMNSIRSLTFDDVATGKKNMREDMERVRSGFRKSANEAQRKLQNGECLSFQ